MYVGPKTIKNFTADDLRQNTVLNFTCQVNLLSQPPIKDNVYCEYLSFEQIERWICCNF